MTRIGIGILGVSCLMVVVAGCTCPEPEPAKPPAPCVEPGMQKVVAYLPGPNKGCSPTTGPL